VSGESCPFSADAVVQMVRLASIFSWNILLNPDKVAFACSEDKATLESDLSAVAGGRPMGRGQLLRPSLS
jgi:hypothetical protein